MPPVAISTTKCFCSAAAHHGSLHLLQIGIRYPLLITQYAFNLLMRAQLGRGTKALYSAAPWDCFGCLGEDSIVWWLK